MGAGVSIHTLSKRAPTIIENGNKIRVISIHALAGRATSIGYRWSTDHCNFNPRPCKKGRLSTPRVVHRMWAWFQYTPSQGGRLIPSGMRPGLLYFNPHPHTEGDSFDRSTRDGSSNFNPRPRTEDDPLLSDGVLCRSSFNPHPRRGGDLRSSWALLRPSRSNSRPRRESDVIRGRLPKTDNVSIHTLAGRAADKGAGHGVLIKFQSTPSQGGRSSRMSWCVRPVSFQSTRSQGGRHRQSPRLASGSCFNSHLRKEGDPLPA